MNKQDYAVLREFKEALEDGRLELAWRIYRENPDLQREFDETAGNPLGV